MRFKSIALALAAVCVLTASFTLSSRDSEAALPALPSGWPSTMQLGMADGVGKAATTAATADFGFRYQYLAGGVNTGSGWATWNPNGNFATYYIQDSVDHGITPVFTYYQIYQSSPGRTQSESAGITTNLNNASTMAAYYNDLKLFFQRAGAFPTKQVVLHVEPDLWAFAQQQSSNDNASTVSVKVGASGMGDVAGLPDNLSGFARAIDRLRDTYAPNVLLGYHMSTWGTGNNIIYSNPSNTVIDALATRAANFYGSLQGNFDVVFAEFTDRDAGFKQHIYGDNGASAWDAGDFDRFARFLTTFTGLAQKRIVLWQIPLGNTKMRALNNTWNHYQDNKVQTFLDDPARTRLDQYRQAGVVAFLFGRGADGATCACDANGDGVTNPAAINGNNTTSLTADDDGGFFRQKTAAYYSAGAMTLGGGSAPAPTQPPPSPTQPPANPTQPPATPTKAPASPTRPPATATQPAPSSTPVTKPPPAGAFSATVAVDPASVARGSRVVIGTSVTYSGARTALVDIEIYSPTGAKVYQKVYDQQAFAAGVAKAYMPRWRTPSNLAPGTYTVKVGIFTPGWGTLLYWNNGAATFTVQ